MRKSVILAGIVVAAAAAAPVWAAGKAPKDRVLILLADNFNHTEYYVPMLALRSVGYQTDVAGIRKGTVYVRGPDKPSSSDVQANLALDDVTDPTRWAGLVIPGGFSPGNLEKHPRSLEICRAFVAAGVPVGAVCHGPRLLMRAGLMKQRVGTSLYAMANELCDAWKAREYGCWFDRPVVVDGPIVTAAHFVFIGAFCRTLAAKMEARGGLAMPKADANAVVVATGAASGHVRWAISSIPRELGRVHVRALYSPADVKKLVEAADYDPKAIDALIVLPGKGVESLKAEPAFARLLKDVQAAGKPAAGVGPAADALAGAGLKVESCPIPAEAYEEYLAPIVRLAQRGAKGRAAPKEVPAAPTVCLYVKHGFDERVFAAVDVQLKAAGQVPIVVANEKGWVRSRDGWPVEAVASVADACGLSDRTIVLSAEGLHPLKTDSGVVDKALSAVAAAAVAPAPVAAEYDAAIALREGFDGYVYAAMRARLLAAGRKVLVVGPAKGKMAGINGIVADVAGGYGDDVKLAAGAPIVAPGGLWPEKAAARQATQPAWIDEQAARDARRIAWILARYKAGATLLTVGFDSLFIGRSELFGSEPKKPKVFAAPEQAVYAWGRGGGRGGGSQPALRTDQRLVSVRGADVLAEGLKLLEAK